MAVQSIIGYALNSDELDRSLAFYTEVLGLTEQRREEGEGVTSIILQAGDAPQPLVVLGNRSDEAAHGIMAGWGRTVFMVDDAAAVVETARTRGCKVIHEPSDHGRTVIGMIEDPDGNIVELVQYNA